MNRIGGAFFRVTDVGLYWLTILFGIFVDLSLQSMLNRAPILRGQFCFTSGQMCEITS